MNTARQLISNISMKQRLANFVANLTKHEIFLLAGSLAYTTGLALAPFVLILLSAATLLGAENQKKLFESFTAAAGEQAGASIQMIVDNAEKHPQASGVSGLIGFIVLLVSASAIFSQLRYALDKVNEHKADESESGALGFVKEKIFSVGLLLGFIFLAVASLMVTATITVIAPTGEGILWTALSFLMNLLIFSALFTAIYRFVPTDKFSWKKCALAGGVSGGFFLIGKFAIGQYLAQAGLESSYGAAGSIVVFLAWAYYSSLTLLISYEFTMAVISTQTKARK